MGTSHDDNSAFMTISARILIRIRRFRTKFVEKIKTRLYVQYFFFKRRRYPFTAYLSRYAPTV